MDSDILALCASELARRIRDRELSSVEVVSAHLRRIDAANPALHAVVAIRAEGALEDAAAADAALVRGDAVGPLHGVPITVKDWIETNDLPCAAGYEERRTRIPKQDASVVARMRAAGAIVIGKTKTGATADIFPRANNPYDLSRTTGGGSAGEAAIIAAGGSPLGLASDSGGSLRWPAHCCGIATLKPSMGVVPLTGHWPPITVMVDPRTAIGPMARRIEDLALTLPILAGPDGRDPSALPVPTGDRKSVSVAGLRVAVFTDMPGAAPTPDTVATTHTAAKTLQDAGANVVEATPPRLDESIDITLSYWARVSSNSAGEWTTSGTSSLDGMAVERSLFEWDRFRRSMLEFLGTWDAVISPVAEGPAPLHDSTIDGQTYLYMLPWSLTGHPVVVVRAGTSTEGLPLGVQVIARHWHDHVTLALAEVIETATGGWLPPALLATD